MSLHTTRSGLAGRRLPRRPAFFIPTLLSVALLSSASGVGLAHDLWIEPSSFVLEPGAPLSLGLRIGDTLGEPFPRAESLILRFESVSPDGSRRPVLGIEGGDPAGFVRPALAGFWTISYESVPSYSHLSARKFESYLIEEGLERISELRRKRGEAESDGTELFSRSVKTLVRVGSAASARLPSDQQVGLPLELVLVSRRPSDPAGELVFELLFHGQPVTGARVDIRRFGAEEIDDWVRSDEHGRVRFASRDGGWTGRWIVAAVHMLPAEEAPGRELSGSTAADWRSWFSTLTFEIGQD